MTENHPSYINRNTSETAFRYSNEELKFKMKTVDTSLRHYLLPNINDNGWKYISIMTVFAIFTALIWFPLGVVFFALSVWCFYAFRDPDRVTPIISDALIAPADGVITSITKEKGPDCLGFANKTFVKISIFSGICDANIYRCPIKSKIAKVFYDCGKNFSLSLNKDDIGNERLSFSLKTSNGYEFIIQQTSTLCSKRLKAGFKQGQEFLAGQRIGYSVFGAYTDIFLPEKVSPIVCVGQKMIAGETIMADLHSDAPRIEGEIR